MNFWRNSDRQKQVARQRKGRDVRLLYFPLLAYNFSHLKHKVGKAEGRVVSPLSEVQK